MKSSILAAGFVLAIAGNSAYAATADDTCIIDTIMKDNRVAMDKMVAGIYKANVTDQMKAAIDAAPSVKDASCLPILDTLDSLIRLRIPSIGAIMGGLMTKIRDMACNMANSYLEQLASKAQFNYSDPLGVASVGVGLTTDGSNGVSTETYDLSKVVEDAATQAVKQKIQQEVRDAGNAIGRMPSGPANRVPKVEDTISNGLKDAINGL